MPTYSTSPASSRNRYTPEPRGSVRSFPSRFSRILGLAYPRASFAPGGPRCPPRARRARSRDRRARARRRRRRGRPACADARGGRGQDDVVPPRGLPCRARHELLAPGSDDADRRRAADPPQRRRRCRAERRARLRDRHEPRVGDDAAHRRGAGRLRVVRGRARPRGAVARARHRRQRAQPQPLLAAAVRAGRDECLARRLPDPSRGDLRRAEGRVAGRPGLRRRRLATRERPAGRRPADALADEVRGGARHRLPSERADSARHGRVRHPPVRRQLEPVAVDRASVDDDDRRSPTTGSSSRCSAQHSTARRSPVRSCRSSTASSESSRTSRRRKPRSTPARSPPRRAR